jgi:hypothetical protein
MPRKRGFPSEYHFRSYEEGGIWDWGVLRILMEMQVSVRSDKKLTISETKTVYHH